MSERIQLRLTIPVGSELHDYLSGRITTEQKYEILMLATNGLRFEKQVKQMSLHDHQQAPSVESTPVTHAEPAVEDKSTESADEPELSLVNIGDALAEYV